MVICVRAPDREGIEDNSKMIEQFVSLLALYAPSTIKTPITTAADNIYKYCPAEDSHETSSLISLER